MKPSRRIDEPTGRMVNDHGHCELQYDPPVVRNSDAPGHNLESCQAIELRRRKHGWTAKRQRTFINVLANTGSIAHAAEAADITPRSAYRLRDRPGAHALSQGQHPVSRHAEPGGAPIARHVLEQALPAMRDSVTLV